MSDISQNPSFHPSKPPHKLGNKHVLLKNKSTKKSATRSRNNNNNNNNNNHMMLNNTNNNNNNRPLKVVHISNPMRYQVAAAGFRALVQGLTGRDSVVEWPIDHHETDQVVVAPFTTTNTDDDSGGNNSTDDHSSSPGQQNDADHHQQHNFSSSLSVCFEPSDQHDHLMSIDDYFGAHNNFNGDVTVPDDDDDVQFQQLYGCYGGLSSPSFYGII